MLERAAPASTPAAKPERNDTQLGDRPTWGARQGGPRPDIPAPPEHLPETAEDQTALARHWSKLLLDTYSARTSFFPGGLFADPAWDMLLDLMHARLNGKRISVSSLCIAARVPATTALRRIGDLVSTGLATRVRDENDGRRVFIELTEDGFARMARYLEQVRVAVNKPPAEPRRKA
jgi:DNA-binding MarR family transcriptional regulator